MKTPFELVYDAIYDSTARDPIVSDLVRAGNMVNFAGRTRDPMKQSVAAADLPELALTSEGFTAINLHNTSSTSMLTRRYSWLLSTGDMRLQELLYPVQWAIVCAAVRWQAVLGALRWRDAAFVKRVSLNSANEGLSDKARNRGITGWSSIMSLDVEMHFSTAELGRLG